MIWKKHVLSKVGWKKASKNQLFQPTIPICNVKKKVGGLYWSTTWSQFKKTRNFVHRSSNNTATSQLNLWEKEPLSTDPTPPRTSWRIWSQSQAARDEIYQDQSSIFGSLDQAKLRPGGSAWMSQELRKWLVNGYYNLFINGVYPLTNHFLSSWNIQVSFEKKARSFSLSSSFFSMLSLLWQRLVCCIHDARMPNHLLGWLWESRAFFLMWKRKASFLYCSNIRNRLTLYHSVSILDGVNQTSWESETDFHQPFPHFGSVRRGQ